MKKNISVFLSFRWSTRIPGGYAIFRIVEMRFDWPPAPFDLVLLVGGLYAASWLVRRRLNKQTV